MNCPTCNATVVPGVAFCPECGTRLPQTAQPMRVLQDRYELTKKLGQGGMGAVYLASDRRLSTVRWAVKEMSDALITSPLERQQASEAFKHEAELLARLSHINLPRVTDHFAEDNKNYLVMEFVPGETLQSYIQRGGLPRPVAEVIGWLRQLCDVLAYLHAQSPPIIFRDLKPANVMLTPEGPLKLIDFGIARLFKPGQARDTQAYGTMGYSAPEQYGRGQTDARSDVYSLGVLIHQLLTGHDPAASPFRFPPADQLNPAVSPQLAAALACATENDPDRRYASIVEFRDAVLGAGNLVQRGPGQLVAPAVGPTIAIGAGAPPAPLPYQAPGSQQYAAPGSQHYPAPGSQPIYGSTGLASAAFWTGLSGVAVMLIATLMVAVAAFGEGTSDPVGGFGILFGLVGFCAAPVAGILGIIALNRQETAATTKGRRNASVGVASAVGSLLLCCVMTVLIGMASDTTPDDQGGRPGAIVAAAYAPAFSSKEQPGSFLVV